MNHMVQVLGFPQARQAKEDPMAIKYRDIDRDKNFHYTRQWVQPLGCFTFILRCSGSRAASGFTLRYTPWPKQI